MPPYTPPLNLPWLSHYGEIHSVLCSLPRLFAFSFLLLANACASTASTQCEDGNWCPALTRCGPLSECLVLEEHCDAFEELTPCGGPARALCQQGACVASTCGDSIVDEIRGELCDEGQGNSNAIDASCRNNCMPQICGDSIVDSDEVCDEGSANSSLEPGSCRTSCTAARCGDGVLDPGESPFCLAAPRKLAVGQGPEGFVIADFNRDGLSDLATANATDNTVSLLLAIGQGAFAPVTTHNVGLGATGIAAADLNNDTYNDIVVTNRDEDTISILSGAGDGTFGAATNINVGRSPIHVAIAHLDDNGVLDLVVTNSEDGTISVLLGQPGSSYSYVGSTYSVGTSPQFAAIYDLNNANGPDLIVSNFGDDTISILLNQGDGSFAAANTAATGSKPQVVIVHDATHDGIPDVIVGNSGANQISILPGIGDGTFFTQLSVPAIRNGGVIALGDYDDDGIQDLLVSDSLFASVVLLRGNTQGFDTPVVVENSVPITNAQFVDIDADGRLDLVASIFTDDNLALYIGGDGFLGVQQTADTGELPVVVSFGEFNQDGVTDAIVANLSSGDLSFLAGQRAGGFAQEMRFLAGQDVGDVVVAKLNNDDFDDLLVACNGNEIVVLHGNSSTEVGTEVLRIATLDNLATVLASDVNGDGRTDVIATGAGGIEVFTQNAEGQYLKTGAILVANASRPTLADMNGDDILDLVFVAGTRTQILAGDVNGDFSATPIYDQAGLGAVVAVGDVNEDGVQDLLLGDWFARKLTLLLGIGEGQFTPGFAFAPTLRPSAIALDDVNGDGHLDILAVGAEPGLSGVIEVHPGLGDGRFATIQTYPSGPTPGYLTTADFNQDGLADLALIDSAGVLHTQVGRPIGDL